jgi:cell filamentation protein, protein adenylyltransferase
MRRGLQGRHVRIGSSPEPYHCFIPAPLPPDPPLTLDLDIFELSERANRALGRLDALATLLPDSSLFLYLYVRKEALLSSQIEGTQSSFSDLLIYEHHGVPGVPIADVEDVSHYVAAMSYGLRRLRDGFPLSLRLIREIHEILLSGGRGSEKSTGEFRTSQNWIGGTRPGNAAFVPPPPYELMACLDRFEKFLHDQPERLPPLIKAALLHVQFESIHPFLDGNGRLGRLLITLLLCADGVLREPLLYLSLYFKSHRERYYDLLQSTRAHGDWEAWLHFFLEGVALTAEQASETAIRILELFARDEHRITETGRASGSTSRLHHLMRQNPLLTVRDAAAALDLATPTVRVALDVLSQLGIVREITGRQRDRLYAYQAYLEILNEGTEPLR